jgi:hypothetical protein
MIGKKDRDLRAEGSDRKIDDDSSLPVERSEIEIRGGVGTSQICDAFSPSSIFVIEPKEVVIEKYISVTEPVQFFGRVRTVVSR